MCVCVCLRLCVCVVVLFIRNPLTSLSVCPVHVSHFMFLHVVPLLAGLKKTVQVEYFTELIV